MNQKWLVQALAAGLLGGALSLVSVHAQARTVPFPVWGQVRELFIKIPLLQSGAPYTVKGTVMDSNDATVREFDDRGVNDPLFSKYLPALSPGTYRLKITITDKNGAVKELNRFPPLNVNY